MDMGLSGRRILVGGATRGLGSAIATVLAGEGARLAAMARGSERPNLSDNRNAADESEHRL